MLDWQTSKSKSLSADTYIEEVGHRYSKNLDDKVPKKSILGTCENSLNTTDCFCMLKKTRIKNIKNAIIGGLNMNSLPKKLTI